MPIWFSFVDIIYDLIYIYIFYSLELPPDSARKSNPVKLIESDTTLPNFTRHLDKVIDYRRHRKVTADDLAGIVAEYNGVLNDNESLMLTDSLTSSNINCTIIHAGNNKSIHIKDGSLECEVTVKVSNIL